MSGKRLQAEHDYKLKHFKLVAEAAMVATRQQRKRANVIFRMRFGDEAFEQYIKPGITGGMEHFFTTNPNPEEVTIAYIQQLAYIVDKDYDKRELLMKNKDEAYKQLAINHDKIRSAARAAIILGMAQMWQPFDAAMKVIEEEEKKGETA